MGATCFGFIENIGQGITVCIPDHWIQESIKQIINSGLFGAVGDAEKKNPNCHKYANFEVNFFMFSWSKKHFF